MPNNVNNATPVVRISGQTTERERVFVRSIDLVENLAIAYMLRIPPTAKQADGYAVSPELYKNIENGLAQHVKALERRVISAKTRFDLDAIQTEIRTTLNGLGDGEFVDSATKLRALDEKVDAKINTMLSAERPRDTMAPTLTTATGVGSGTRRNARKSALTTIYQRPAPTAPDSSH